jgi:hypothetical protein
MSPWSRSWTHPFWTLVGLLVAYYAVPVHLGDSVISLVVSLAVTAAGLGLVGTMMVKELARLRQGEATRSARALSMLLVLLVMSYSLAYFLLDLVEPDEMADLDTRTDALYFTLSTMATVGYGDIHAEGQVARGLVCGLIVFNVAVVGTLARAQMSHRESST